MSFCITYVTFLRHNCWFRIINIKGNTFSVDLYSILNGKKLLIFVLLSHFVIGCAWRVRKRIVYSHMISNKKYGTKCMKINLNYICQYEHESWNVRQPIANTFINDKCFFIMLKLCHPNKCSCTKLNLWNYDWRQIMRNRNIKL